MGKIFAGLAQFLLFLLLFFVGSFVYQPFHATSRLAMRNLHARSFIWDGVLLMVIAYVLILLIAAARKRLERSALATTAALVLAGLAGYALKFGFVTHGW